MEKILAHGMGLSLTAISVQIEILTVKGAHFYEMGLRKADLVVLGQVPKGCVC